MKHLRLILPFVALLACSSWAWSDNLLTNPGFETGNFTGWTTGGASASSGVDLDGTLILGSSFPPNTVNAIGTFGAWGVVRGFCCAPSEALILSQTIAVTPGTNYSIGFSLSNQSGAGVGSTTGDGPNMIQIFVDGVGLLAPSGNTGLLPSVEWYTYSSTFNSGAASSVTVDFRAIASGSGYVGLSLDDFYVSTVSSVPEPTSLAQSILALGGLLWAVRKRTARLS